MPINRRGFLKAIGAMGSTSLIGSYNKASAQNHLPGYPDRSGVLHDIPLCTGCRKCEWACKDQHKFPNKAIETFDDKSVFEKKRRTDQESYTVVNSYPNPVNKEKPVYVKRQCNHCDEPACASACLVKAFTKTPEGSVRYNKNVCVGCRYCMTACPFYVPAYDYHDPLTPEIRKCTLCYERITKKGEIPACVKICPTQALTFGKRNELLKLAKEKIRSHPEHYVNHVYGEHEVGGTCWLYISGVPFEQLGFDMNLGAKPYPELTRGFLSMVPAVLVIWPALLGGFYMFTQHREGMDEEEEEILAEKED
jgi:Fe-S-cluster-containing dehydrogenase component